MYKTVKTIVLAFSIVFIFFITSCIKTEDQLPRTPETEKNELNEALAILVSKGYDIDTTALGVFYIVQKEGEGPFAQAGDTLKLEYTGYLLNGAIFDASSFHYTDGIWELVFKELDLIPGFEDGISIMNKGAEIQMFIPSELAYGASGGGSIPPYSTLSFAAKMHDLKQKQE